MKAKSINVNSIQGLKDGIQETIQDGFAPALAIVFQSISHDIDVVSEVLKKHNLKIFGATTNGEFIDDNVQKESISVMLLEFKRSDFETILTPYNECNYREVASRITKDVKQKWDNPKFLLAGSHMETDAEELLEGFKNVAGVDVEVYGCMAGDDYSFKQQFVFTEEGKLDQGMAVLAFDGDKYDVYGHALCGWKSAGTEKTVTKSEGNKVYTIDDVPALDITVKFGGLKNVSVDNENLITELATLCPLQLQRENAPPVMRPGLVVDWESRAIFCSGKVPQGSKVKFSLPPDFDAIDEVINGCREIKGRMPDVDAIIYFTCAGRLLTFGPLMSEEIKGIMEVWDAPMIGMFSNAELGKAKGGELEMHNLSSCCVVIKEK